jgi:hypothetical protein
MDVIIEFNEAAFKHGVSEKAIRAAIEKFVYDNLLPDATDRHLLLGFDNNANLLEVIYNVIDEQTITVFHAMKCRKTYFTLVDL